MERSATDPDAYLAALDDERVADVMAVDRCITDAMPDRSRTLWTGVFWGGTEQSIIGYGDLVQRRPSGDVVDWFVVGLALQKQHLSVYVNAVLDGEYLAKRYAERLGTRRKVKVGAASLGFVAVDAIDLDVLAELCAHASRLCPPES